MADASFSTLVELLRHRALEPSDRTAFVFLESGETESDRLTFAALDLRARAIAAQLEESVGPGDRALLLYPPGLDFISAFFGCLYAGVVAVPAQVPGINRKTERLETIVADAQAVAVLTTAVQSAKMSAGLAPELARLRWLSTDEIASDHAARWRPPDISGETLGILQYTSGSTSVPKGVMVNHRNFLHTSLELDLAWDHTAESVMVTWLPTFHDLGLVYGVIQPVFRGFTCYMMAPAAFLVRPYRWLRAISTYRATHTCSPNFAFDLCVDKVTPEQRAALDLSSWLVALNGAEPVRESTVRRFAETFAGCGFDPATMCPSYGLAEATLKVSTPRKKTGPFLIHVDPEAFARNRVVEMPAERGGQAAVACGRTETDTNIAIVDPETLTRCGPDEIGEIWVSSRSVAQGYWRKPELSEQTFRAHLADTGEGPFLRTGDLGFMKGEQLFVAGRIKDLIVIHGLNHYPQDIEYTVEASHPAVRKGGGAAFSVEVENEERLVIAQEIDRTFLRKSNTDEIIGAIRQALSEEHELQTYAVLLLKPGSIPKTSSGKIQRQVCAALYLEGGWETIAEWRQTLTPPTRSMSRSRDIEANIVEILCGLLRIAPHEIDVRQPFARYGMDSVTAAGLSADLSGLLGRSLPPTLAFDHPTVESLTRYLSGGDASARPLAAEHTDTEPVAVVGVGCRFPGAKNPAAFWELLRDGIDAITETPRSRWDVDAFYDPAPATPGRMNTRWGGFLQDDVGLFDAEFFGVAPREADAMDPQQRLLLEVGWEALENAGVAPDRLAGTPTGVFVGISASDYSTLQLSRASDLSAYAGTGTSLSIAANRLSYALDLRGPSVAVDTACSSSLVAVHLACQSLRRRECSVALAGGVNLVLTPGLSIALSQARMLSGAGRCKAFDAGADGYVRGEGCGVVVLKRLADAVADRDRILAVIRGSAVNQDGRSNGLTAPNGPAQQAVVRQALQDAGIAPGQVAYVETHGTGTPLGDPIELNSLKEALAPGRDAAHPFLAGSVKTNIGHLEAAAGIAGLIKVTLALQHGKIPAHLHLTTLNPYVSDAGAPCVVPARCQDWPAGPRIAGVSSFGFGGANAHVILEEAPRPQPASLEPDRPAHLVVVSGKTEEALAEIAASYQAYLRSNPDVPLGDVAFAANAGRSHFGHRLAITANSSAEAAEQLGAFVQGRRLGRHAGTVNPRRTPKIAFLFTGQGAQYEGMARELYETDASFRRVLDECSSILRPQLPVPLIDSIYASGDGSLLDSTAYTQPALFALEYALAQLWRGWGIEPAAVLGHSVGEYVAACVAGVFTLEDGLKLVCQRGRLMQDLPPGGAMAVLFAPEARVAAAIEGRLGDMSIAAVNGPRNTVVSGRRTAVDAVVEELGREGVGSALLRVSHAFHSPLMEPILGPFAEAVERTALAAPQIPLVSNVTGAVASERFASAHYWVEHVRKPVRFAAGMQALERLGCDAFLEVGPQPQLIGMARQVLGNAECSWLPSLRRGSPDWQQILESMAELYARGSSIDWQALDREHPRGRIDLPTYAFQRQRYWIASDGPVEAERPAPAGPLYSLLWQPVTMGVERKEPRRWLILPGADGVARSVAAHLRDAGHHVTEDVGARVDGVLDFRALDLAAPEATTEPTLGCAAVLELVQRLAGAQASTRVWLFTRGAVATDRDRGVSNVAQSALWGLARVIGLEHPELSGGIVDLSAEPSEGEAAAVVAGLLSAAAESQTAIRDGRAYAPRLTRASVQAPKPFAAASDGAYLITGGLGALGLLTAAWLVERGARHIALCGRRNAWQPPDIPGATVRVIQADVSAPGDVRRLLEDIELHMPPLRGVIHAAGVLDDGILLRQTSERFADVMAAKVKGAWNLHAATRGLGLDFFVLFSSAASLLGSPGQGNYAAANAFMDGLAQYRRAQGLPALSINWGPWEGGGIAADLHAGRRRHLDAQGVAPMAPRACLEALTSLLGSSRAQIGVMSLDWAKFENRNARAGSQTSSSGLALQIRHAVPAERKRLLIAHIQAEVARALGTKGKLPDPNRGFFDMGMDSLMALGLKSRLADSLDIRLPATLTFEHPTIEAVAEYLLEQTGLNPSPGEAASRPSAQPIAPSEAVAIIGIGCRFPGGARDPEGFWRVLAQGIDAVSEIPESRWDRELYYDPDPDEPGKISTRCGAFLSGIDQFDADFFGISPREAESMDPQQRLLLMVAWEALENAGYSATALAGSSTGVFLGIGQNDYAQRRLNGGDPSDITAYDGTGNGFCFASGRLSYVLGLRGPNLAVDTACSSSLVSVHLACQSLRLGECGLALAGGVQLIVSPEVTVFLSRARALSRDGRSKAFDASADGYGRGEGCGMVVLKRLSDAVRDHDRIYAVIRGSAVNHDGASSGLTVPRGAAQEELIRSALAAGTVSPAQVDYLEAHGTGTVLGDPIEVHAASAVYGAGRADTRPLLLGSVKTNIGHLEAAAGIAGLIKVALAMEKEQLPPHLHFTTPNPHIEWNRILVQVLTRSKPWTRGGTPRIAGISSFGISGTNAHVILEEAPPTRADGERRGPGLHVLALSAKTPEALTQLASGYREYLGANADADLADVCFTAAVGRAHFRYRWTAIAGDVAELLELLKSVAPEEADEQTPRVVFRFTGGAGLTAAESWRSWGLAPAAVLGDAAGSGNGARVVAAAAPGDIVVDVSPSLATERTVLDTVARAYRRGVDVDWPAFFRGRPGRRVALPTYPFQMRRHWISSPRATAMALADKFYEIAWQPTGRAGAPANGASGAAGSWLILSDRAGVGASLTRLLARRGQTCVMAQAGEAVDWGADYRGIVHLWSLDARTLEEARWLGCQSALEVLQSSSARLWVVTRNAVPAGPAQAPLALCAAPLWGFARSVALERPEQWGGAIDLPPEVTDESLEAAVSQLVAPDGEDQVAIRGKQRYAARLQKASPVRTGRIEFGPDDAVLVVGGWGALGLQAAGWMVGRGARHLVLTGRTQPSEQAREALVALERSGAAISVIQADAADEAQMRRVFASPVLSGHPLKGVVHAAGVAAHAPLDRLEPAALDAALRAKVSGAWILHQLTRELDLKVFVCFSSIASVWGSKGQAHYAAANHFLDMLAHDRRRAGLPALTVNWGPWTGGGMASREALASLERIGIRPFTPAQAVEALDYLLGTDAVQITAARVDWPAFREAFESRAPRPFLNALPVRAQRPQQPGERSAIAARLAQASPADRVNALIHYLQSEVAGLLGLPPSAVPPPRRGFFAMGMDSIMAVELRRKLEHAFDGSLPTTVAFEYPNVLALADFLANVLGYVPAVGAGENGTAAAEVNTVPDSELERSIAERLEKLEGLVRRAHAGR